jgi:outer membrane protein OmpA-like peptidoglycan-associated protein
MNKLIAVSIALSSLNAFAIDLTGFKFSDSFRYSYLEDAGLDAFRGPLILTGSFAHIEKPLFVTDENSLQYKKAFVENNNLLNLGASLNFAQPRLRIGLESNLERVKTSSDSYLHFSDLLIRSRYTFYATKAYAYSINPFVSLPTGKKSSFTTKGSIGSGVRAVAERRLDNVSLLGSIGYAHADQNKYQIINYRNLFLMELGLSVDVTDKLNINLEVNRNFTTASDSHQDEGDYYLTFKQKMRENMNLYGGLGIAGLNDLDKKNWTAFAGVKFDFGGVPEIVHVIKPPIKKEEIKPVPIKPIVQPPVVVKTVKDEKALGPVFKIENIYFANGKINITQIEMIKIKEFTENIKKEQKTIKHIVIEGFASKTGNSKRNQKLSMERALEVQNSLIQGGISKEMTSIVAFGDTSSKQYKDINKNRRVQFRVYVTAQ